MVKILPPRVKKCPWQKGRGGKDRLWASGGNDILIGKEGNDTLNGGRGDDRLEGHYGADTFVFNIADSGHDTIWDFNMVQGRRSGEGDKILFTGSAEPDSFDDLTFTEVNEREVKYIPAGAKWIRGVGYDRPLETEIVRDVLVTWGDGENSITLGLYCLSDVRADDFIFA